MKRTLVPIGLALLAAVTGGVQSARAQTVADVLEEGLVALSCPLHRTASRSPVTTRLVQLFEAINAREDPAMIVREFFRGFRWFSVNSAVGSGHDHFAGYTWDEIESYLQERYAQNEHLELRAIRFNAGGFGPIEVVRRADDLPESQYKLGGKGYFDCISGSFVVLSLGTALAQADYISPFGLTW